MDYLTTHYRLIFLALATLVGTVVIGYFVRVIVFKWVERLTRKTKTRFDDIILTGIAGPSWLWFFLLGMNLSSRIIHHNPLLQRWIDRVTIIIWIVSITWALGRIAGELISRYGSKRVGAIAATSLTQNFAKIVVYLIGLLFIFQALSISITPIITALGVGGLAVALALQDTLSNLFSGMYLMMAQQIRVNDYVKLESGEEGYVADISWRATTIRALANNNIIVPNSKLAQTILTNYHLPEPRMSLLVPISVSYDSDPDQVEKILIEEALHCADEFPGLLKEPEPFVRFIPGFGDSSLDFTLICQVKEFVDQYPAQHRLRKRIFRRFRAEGIEIPFPQRTLHIPQGLRVYPVSGSDQP